MSSSHHVIGEVIQGLKTKQLNINYSVFEIQGNGGSEI